MRLLHFIIQDNRMTAVDHSNNMMRYTNLFAFIFLFYTGCCIMLNITNALLETITIGSFTNHTMFMTPA